MKKLDAWNLLFVICLSIHSTWSLLNSTNEDTSCPMCKNLAEMPIELADQINTVEDVDIFIHDFVEDTNSLTNVTNVKNTRIRRAAKDTIKQATCQPIDQVVSVVPKDERDPTVFYFPSCVLIKQCGGCCAHSGTTCSPTDEEEKTVTVKKTKFNGGSKLQALGDIQVTVKEHKRCRCQCKKTAADCNGLQRFIPGQCRCECTNLKEADECTKNPAKLWDPKTCRCVCKDTKECGYDYNYDQETCSCVQRPKEEEFEDDEELTTYFGNHSSNETYEVSEDSRYETETATASI